MVPRGRRGSGEIQGRKDMMGLPGPKETREPQEQVVRMARWVPKERREREDWMEIKVCSEFSLQFNVHNKSISLIEKEWSVFIVIPNKIGSQKWQS